MGECPCRQMVKIATKLQKLLHNFAAKHWKLWKKVIIIMLAAADTGVAAADTHTEKKT